ncbi:polysaccharide lyase family 8 super-sandwich domain-containing protein [Kitasatospora sp. NPDC056273]|uniref:polysaccharide lyase family 8 super-sandwich domain-containing protein n=1 Tax=Kitasatospora sp. NPDC056273 TaxID=3345769 RepID=UPI0035DB4037
MTAAPNPALLSRRRLLRLAAIGTTALTLGALPTPATAAADAYDTLRLRWLDLLTGTGFDPATAPYATTLAALGDRARTQLQAMAPTSTSLWPDLPLGTASANVTASHTRLRTLAMAWAQPGTGLTGDQALATAITTGLNHLNTTTGAYTPTATAYGNWWDWQIGTPQALLDTCVLAHDLLPPTRLSALLAAVDRQVPDSLVSSYTGTSTGGNRVDLCRVLALRGVLGRTSAKLTTATTALSPVFPYVLAGDGLYADGSFVQHTWVPYTGSYGEVLLGGLSRLFALLAGSAWQISDPSRQNVFDAVTDAYAPFLYNGLVMDAVSGRAVSRGRQSGDQLQLQQDDHVRGHTLIGHILRLADSGAAPAAQSAAWRSAVKGWLTRDHYLPYLSNAYLDVPELARAQALLNSATAAAPEPLGARVFAMDRAVVRRSGWAASLSLCSARTTFYETGNGEHLRGWHTNNGMLSWWGATFGNGQYSDAFWPTVDPYRLPGTTVSAKPLADAAGGTWGAPHPDSTWAGGATDGTYAAVGQDLRGLSSTLTGRKSWFLLDDAVVCLGAGISCTDGTPVETVVDNRNLGPAGTHALTVDGAAQPTTLGWSQRLDGARAVAVAGFGGYVLPAGTTLRAKREARTGSWHDINTGGSTEQLTRRYLTLWFDHGTNPTDAGYEYQVLPGATAAATAARAAAPTVTTLANSRTVQAISDSASGVTAANFFAAGTAGPLTASAPCSVLVRDTDSTRTVTVADPSRRAATVTLTLAGTGRPTEAAEGVSVLSTEGAVTLLVELGGTQGAGRTITLTTASGAPATATATLLDPTQDSYVRDGSYATTNYGTATTLTVKNTNTTDSGFSRRALLTFDTTAVPGTVRRAVLWVHGAVADSGGTLATLQAFTTAPTPWTEPAVTWANAPGLAQPLGTGRISTTPDWIPLDVTPAVTPGNPSLTLALFQPLATVGLAVNLDARSHTTFHPVLEVITS